jgi:hypothetical protein
MLEKFTRSPEYVFKNNRPGILRNNTDSFISINICVPATYQALFSSSGHREEQDSSMLVPGGSSHSKIKSEGVAASVTSALRKHQECAGGSRGGK